jgi:hypothetical protein
MPLQGSDHTALPNPPFRVASPSLRQTSAGRRVAVGVIYLQVRLALMTVGVVINLAEGAEPIRTALGSGAIATRLISLGLIFWHWVESLFKAIELHRTLDEAAAAHRPTVHFHVGLIASMGAHMIAILLLTLADPG